MFGIVNCKAQIYSLKRKETDFFFRQDYLNAEVEYVDVLKLAALQKRSNLISIVEEHLPDFKSVRKT